MDKYNISTGTVVILARELERLTARKTLRVRILEKTWYKLTDNHYPNYLVCPADEEPSDNNQFQIHPLWIESEEEEEEETIKDQTQ